MARSTTPISVIGLKKSEEQALYILFRKDSAVKQRGGAQSGFTLIELVLVLVIMAILVGLIMPAMSRTSRSASLETTGEKLCELLGFAYAAAVSRKRPVVVNIVPGRCWVTMRSTALPWLSRKDETETRTLTVMKVPKSIQLTITRMCEGFPSTVASEEWETIVFRSDGRTKDAIIEMIDEKGNRLEVETVGATGQARITEKSY